MTKLTRRALVSGAASLISYSALAEGVDNSGFIGASTFGGLDLLGGAGNSPTGRGLVGARIRQGMNVGTLSGFSGYSWHATQEVPTPFTAVRLVFFNVTTLAIPIDSAIVGTTDSTANALITHGIGAAWANVTFGGSGSGAIPANPNASPLANPTYYFSDWIPLSSIARTDGGTFPLVMARAYFSTTTPLSNMGTGVTVTNWQTEAADLEWYNWYFKSGDFVSSNRTGFVGTSDPGQTPFVGVQYTSTILGMPVVTFGDSNTRGQQASADGNSYFSRACSQLNTNGTPTFYSNLGWGGQSIQQYYTRWKQYLSQAIANSCKPSIAVFEGGTSNGFYAGASTVYLAVINQFISDCRANRIFPIITTMLPDNNYTVAQDNDRILLNTQINALASSTVGVADIAAVVTNTGVSPQQFLTNYCYSDGVHLVDLGHTAAKAPMLAALSAAMANLP